MKTVKYYIATFTLLLLLGCSDKLGYSSRINIEENANITQGDIHLITDILKSRTYEVAMIKEENTWKIETYKIMLEENKFNSIKYKNVGLAVESWCGITQDTSCRIEIRIVNLREGRKKVVKSEIDKITDHIIKNLSKKVNKSLLNVQKQYVSPM
jgi:hypothetical protein